MRGINNYISFCRWSVEKYIWNSQQTSHFYCAITQYLILIHTTENVIPQFLIVTHFLTHCILRFIDQYLFTFIVNNFIQYLYASRHENLTNQKSNTSNGPPLTINHFAQAPSDSIESVLLWLNNLANRTKFKLEVF